MADAVPFQARKAMQEAIFAMFKMENEWTTYTDSITLAEAAAQALEDAGFEVAPNDTEGLKQALWGHIDGSND